VNHVWRVANRAAHHLAKLTISKQLNKVGVDSYPNCLLGIVNTKQLISDNQEHSNSPPPPKKKKERKPSIPQDSLAAKQVWRKGLR
jgi:hypothetical protein